MKTIPRQPKSDNTGGTPEKISDSPAPLIQSTRGRIGRALESIGLLSYRAPRLPDPERENTHLAIVHLEKCIKILPELKNTLWHIYDDLEKIANPKFSELREGHQIWIEKYVTKNINDTFLSHVKTLQEWEESIQSPPWPLQASATLPKIISRLAEIRSHLESIVKHASKIQNPWEAPNGLGEAMSAMELGHRETCSDYLLAEHETIEQGGTKRKKGHQEKGSQDITPIKRAHMVQERRILTKKGTMELFDKFFPPSTSVLIQASLWVCLAAKPRDAKLAFDNEYIPTLKEEMQVLQGKIQGMEGHLTDRANAAVTEARKLFDEEKESHETAEKEGIKAEWELAAARKETKNAKAHAASILSQYEALTEKKAGDGIDELGFDLKGMLPEDLGSTRETEKTEEVPPASPADQQKTNDLRNVMDQAEMQSEIAIQNEERMIVGLTQIKTKAADIKIAMEKAGDILRKKEAFLAEISSTIAGIETAKAIAEKSTRKKRLYYWLPWTTATLVAVLLGQYLSEPSKISEMSAEKKEEVPVVVPKPVAVIPPLSVPAPRAKDIPRVEQILTEAPLSAEQLPTEVMTVLINAGYNEQDGKFMEITGVIVEVLGEKLLATPSQEKRKGIIESVLQKNFGMNAIQAKRELRQYFSHEMQNGTLAIHFTPEISDMIFQEIEKHGWWALSESQKARILENVLHQKQSDTKPQKTKQEVINELESAMEVMIKK